MNLKTVTNKRGAWILEATITLPIFIIAMVIVCSIFLMYQEIENANYIIASELRRAAAESIYINTSAAVPIRVQSEVNESCRMVESLDLAYYKYRGEMLGQDELIALKYNMVLANNNPLNVASRAKYNLSYVTRAYVGKERELDNMTEEEMMADGSAVYVFPKRGEKYHRNGCPVLTATFKSSNLTSSIRDKYKPCPVCHSSKTPAGTTIYYFPRDGESYHVQGCPTLERNYVEMEKRVAVKRGYTACLKCGG